MPDAVVETPAPAAAETPAPDAPAAPPEKPVEALAKPKPGEFARKAQAERERVQRAAAEKAGAEEAAKARAEAAELRSKIEEADKRRATYVQNPLQALLDAFPGMDPVKAFEMLSEAAKNGGKAPVQAETYALQQRLDAMEKARQAEAAANKEAQAKQAQEQAKAVEAAFRKEVSDFVKENAETYELTSLYGQTDAVYAVIDAHYVKTQAETGTGEILPTKKAAEMVEAHLEKLVEKATSAKKVAAKLEARFKPASGEPKTLSNDLATQVATERTAPMTEAERMKRATEALGKFLND